MLKCLSSTLSFSLRNVGLIASGSLHRMNMSTIKVLGESVFEPDYLESLKPECPQYKCLNVQIRGYDFPVLETYQSFLHNAAEYLDLDVSEGYALPPQQIKAQRLRPNSAVVDAEYQLRMYQRVLLLNDVDAPKYPLFLRIAQGTLPEGVSLTVKEHTAEMAEHRYVPDKDLMELKTELEKMHNVKKN